MARLITRIVVRSFGGGETLEVIQASEPPGLKLSGYLDAYRGYFGDPLAELRLAIERGLRHVGWSFAVPEDYNASELPASTDSFELAVIPLVPDPHPDRLGALIPALWQLGPRMLKDSTGIWNDAEMTRVRPIDPDMFREYISSPVL